MTRKKGWTLLALLVVISIIALLIGILLPALGAARKNAQRMENNTRLRGVHQGCVQYAQSNQQAFPGMGGDNVATASGRFILLLNQNLFTGEYVVSPLEASKTTWTSGTFATVNFSYMPLQIAAAATERRNEWGAYNANTQAAMVADRSQAIDSTLPTESVHVSGSATTDWRGGVVWNDNHVSFETDNLLDRTRYGNGSVGTSDDLSVDTDATGANNSGFCVYN